MVIIFVFAASSQSQLLALFNKMLYPNLLKKFRQVLQNFIITRVIISMWAIPFSDIKGSKCRRNNFISQFMYLQEDDLQLLENMFYSNHTINQITRTQLFKVSLA